MSVTPTIKLKTIISAFVVSNRGVPKRRTEPFGNSDELFVYMVWISRLLHSIGFEQLCPCYLYAPSVLPIPNRFACLAITWFVRTFVWRMSMQFLSPMYIQQDAVGVVPIAYATSLVSTVATVCLSILSLVHFVRNVWSLWVTCFSLPCRFDRYLELLWDCSGSKLVIFRFLDICSLFGFFFLPARYCAAR